MLLLGAGRELRCNGHLRFGPTVVASEPGTRGGGCVVAAVVAAAAGVAAVAGGQAAVVSAGGGVGERRDVRLAHVFIAAASSHKVVLEPGTTLRLLLPCTAAARLDVWPEGF